MRFAALSDIHGNIVALEAVIADIQTLSIEQVVNLGDSLSGPLWPAETAAKLIALDWLTVAGNHDRQVLAFQGEDTTTSDGFAAALLTDCSRSWLRTLPTTQTAFGGVLLCHGTPNCDDRYWLHRGKPGAMTRASVSEVSQDATEHELALCGHTHVSRILTLPDGRMVANPGSVGLPAYDDDDTEEEGGPHARYLIAESCSSGWKIELRRVAYDFERAAKRSEETDRKSWAHTLRTGRVLTPK